jgi:GTPase SAR1 family protein
VLSYEGTDCFVVCFSVVDAVTFNNVNKWLEELRNRVPSAKILLVPIS